jgi:hypothetical protein
MLLEDKDVRRLEQWVWERYLWERDCAEGTYRYHHTVLSAQLYDVQFEITKELSRIWRRFIGRRTHAREDK